MIDINNREQVINKLNELKAQNLPHMDIDLFSELDEYFKEQIKTCSEDEKIKINDELHSYLGQNLKHCIICGEEPYLRWGLAHGVMIDNNTGLSWVYYHYFNMNGQNKKFVRLLQYHPDVYEINE
jgi:hypothetical protein